MLFIYGCTENSDFLSWTVVKLVGDSRIDFYMDRVGEKYLMEVKGCTLEVDGIGYFPDAPPEASGKCVYCNHCEPCPAGIDIGAVNKFDEGYSIAAINRVKKSRAGVRIEKQSDKSSLWRLK